MEIGHSSRFVSRRQSKSPTSSFTSAGVPHSLLEDDEYRGWHIPKNTTVIVNIWYDTSISSSQKAAHDPSRCLS